MSRRLAFRPVDQSTDVNLAQPRPEVCQRTFDALAASVMSDLKASARGALRRRTLVLVDIISLKSVICRDSRAEAVVPATKAPATTISALASFGSIVGNPRECSVRRKLMQIFAPRHHLSRIVGGLALCLCALGAAEVAFAAPTTQSVDESGAPREQSLDEVTVVAKMDARTLNRAINQFVQSLSSPTAVIGQVGRWRENVCPAVSGLKDTYGEFVSRRIRSLARSVGAKAAADGQKCAANVEVVFTPEPQQLVDLIARKYRPLLGYYVSSQAKQATAFTHPVQAWYLTGSRSTDGWAPPACISGCGAALPTLNGNGLTPFNTGLTIDEPNSAGPTGTAGSLLGRGLRSEFVHVLIILDTQKVAGHSLQTVSDYIAMLALTHLSALDTCTGLPSIVSLFAQDCGAPPAAITTADTAYLKALYKSNLEQNLNLELGELHDSMLQAIKSH